MADEADRERAIRRLAAALELTEEETAELLARPSMPDHWAEVAAQGQREIEQAQERLRPHLERAVVEQLRNGFGDLSAPLAPGEYVHAANTCPHDGCDWTLPIEWRRESQLMPTRFRGYLETDALCRAHMEQHEIVDGGVSS